MSQLCPTMTFGMGHPQTLLLRNEQNHERTKNSTESKEDLLDADQLLKEVDGFH